jgi:cysteine desulfurase
MSSESRFIYMDHAATTAVDPRVVEAMEPYFSEKYGNPSSVHRLGTEARAPIESARARVAGILNAEPSEIIFTSCGTESDNLALRGIGHRSQGKHIITTPIEHHAVGSTCEQLKDEFGFSITYLPTDERGVVDPADVEGAIAEDTCLISIMYANNEVGTIQPIAEIGKVARQNGIPFHTDAVQAAGNLSLDVDALGVDLLSLSGHKFYAPKGVGILYVREGTELLPAQTGGGHERGLRAGTENVPYIVGLAKALELAYEDMDDSVAHLTALRDRLIEGVLDSIPDVHLTGHPTRRLANSASFVFEGVEGEAIVVHLDRAGVAASTGSACTAEEEGPSFVLEAMGIRDRLAQCSLRLTLGRENTMDDVDYVLSVLPGIVKNLRDLSPFYD